LINSESSHRGCVPFESRYGYRDQRIRQRYPQLRTAANDAVRIGQVLETEFGYNAKLLIEDVTLEKLRSQLGECLPKEVQADDRLPVYFAGHGIALDGDDWPAGYLVPQDARPDDRQTFLPMTDVSGWLNRLPCHHLLLVLDCCFAGAFGWASTRDLDLGAVPEVVSRPFQSATPIGIAAIALPPPSRGMVHQGGADGVEVDIPRHSPEVGLVLHQLGAITTLEHVPAEPVPSGPGVGVVPEERLHAPSQIRLRRLEDHVAVVGEVDESVDPPLTTDRSVAQLLLAGRGPRHRRRCPGGQCLGPSPGRSHPGIGFGVVKACRHQTDFKIRRPGKKL
jgi:hypothetical protein